jgi:predicted MFS family arabinose efflux permease
MAPDATGPAAAGAPRPVGLRRDGLTWLVYAHFSAFAYFLYAFAPSITLLRDDEHLSDTVAGLHGTAFAVGVVAIGLVGQRIIDGLGRLRAMWMFLTGLCVAVGVYISAPILVVTLTGAFLAGCAGSGIAITCSAVLVDHHGPAGPAAMTEANGVAASIGLLAPMAVGAAIRLGIGWRPAMLGLVAFAVVLFLTRRAFGGPPRSPAASVEAAPAVRVDNPPIGERLGRQFRLSATIVMLCVAIEFCMTLWCAQLLRDLAHLGAAAAATGVTAIVAGMGVGRLFGARIARRRDVDWLLARAFALTAVGFAVFWFSTVGVVSFVGLALCGLGMSLHYPMGIARAIRAAPGCSDQASSLVSAGTGVAVGVAPFLLGLFADLVTARYAYLLVPGLLALAAGTLAIARARVPVLTAPAAADASATA